MNSKCRVALASAALSLTLANSFSVALAETKTYSQGGSQTVQRAAGSSAAAAGSSQASGQGAAKGGKAQSGSDLVALQGPKQIVHNGTGWKQNPCYITIKQGQDILPLTLTFTNGAGNTPKATGIRITLNGRRLATEADFKGQDKLSLNMTGFLTSGDTQMVVQTFGPAGATIEWVLTTGKIKVLGVKPDNGAPGDKITISGKNLPKQASAYQLFVGKAAATIKNITDTAIDFIVPQGTGGGTQQIVLYIAGVKCDPITFKIKSAPEVTGVNMIDATPSSTISISGRGFSKVASENEVTVGGMTCTITNASDSSIDVIIPESIACPQGDAPITVKTNGQEAKYPNGRVTVNLSMREIRKGEGFAPGSVYTH